MTRFLIGLAFGAWAGFAVGRALVGAEPARPSPGDTEWTETRTYTWTFDPSIQWTYTDSSTN